MLLSGHFLCLTITILIYKHEKIIRIFLSLWFSLINDIIIFDSGEAKQNFKKLRTKQLNFVSYLAEMIFVINDADLIPCAIQQFFVGISTGAHLFTRNEISSEKTCIMSPYSHLITYLYFTVATHLCFKTICFKGFRQSYFVVKHTLEYDEFNYTFFSYLNNFIWLSHFLEIRSIR